MGQSWLKMREKRQLYVSASKKTKYGKNHSDSTDSTNFGDLGLVKPGSGKTKYKKNYYY
jgi:hypothetical protein